MWLRLRAGFYQDQPWFGPKNPAVVRPSRGAKPAPASGVSLGGRIAVEVRSGSPRASRAGRASTKSQIQLRFTATGQTEATREAVAREHRTAVAWVNCAAGWLRWRLLGGEGTRPSSCTHHQAHVGSAGLPGATQRKHTRSNRSRDTSNATACGAVANRSSGPGGV